MLYKNTEPEIIQVNPFIIINLFDIFSFSKIDLFINSNDLEYKYTEPNKQEDKIIELYIIYIYLIKVIFKSIFMSIMNNKIE